MRKIQVFCLSCDFKTFRSSKCFEVSMPIARIWIKVKYVAKGPDLSGCTTRRFFIAFILFLELECFCINGHT